MTDKNRLMQAEEFYKERIKKWMIGDLRRSIGVETNFLTTMGCFAYTEVIGIVIPPLDKEKGGKGKKRFYRCFFRLPSSNYLKGFDKWLKKRTGKNVYQHFRHNMVHRYYPAVSMRRKDGTIMFAPIVIAQVGFISDRTTGEKEKSFPFMIDKKGRITFSIKNYIDELEEAVDNFYNHTFIKKDSLFQKAASEGMEVLLKAKKTGVQ